MKKIQSLALIFGVVSFSFSATPAQSDAQIASIRAKYASINKRAARYKKVKKQLSGFSLEGGELVAYLNGPSIVKLVANHYGEMGRTLEEYYYSNGKVIFVFEKTYHYNKPMGKVVRTSENRYYFNDNQLIRWIADDARQVAASDANYLAKQKQLLDASTSFLNGTRSEASTIEATN